MEQIMDKIWPWLEANGPNLIYALVILIIGRMIAAIITSSVRNMMTKAKMDETIIKFLGALVKILLMTFVVIASVNQLGVSTTSFIAILGAAGLAIGFALQGSLSNFASGVLLIIFRPFKAGDWIVVNGIAGTVEEVSIFSTLLRTGDNRSVIIPNGNITNGNIINNSAKDTRRVDMVFSIGYDDDIRKAKDILTEIVTSDERVLKDPAPSINVSELAESSVNFVVYPWVKSGDYWGVKYDTLEKVKIAFDEAGISIPYPQTDVHIHQTDNKSS